MRNATIKTILFAISFALGLAAYGVAIAGGRGNLELPPMIIKTMVDARENVLIITGHNFGSTPPTVLLADLALDVKRFSQHEVVANLPQGLVSATYGVSVTTGGRNRASSNLFSATLPDKK